MKKKIIKIIPLVDKDLLELLIIRNEIINRAVSFKTKKISKKTTFYGLTKFKI